MIKPNDLLLPCTNCGDLPESDFHPSTAKTLLTPTKSGVIRKLFCRNCVKKRTRIRDNAITSLYNTKFLYIIINPAFNGYIKVGIASNLGRRLSGYNTGTPFRDYEYYFSIESPYAYKIEQMFKNKYSILGYEWYQMDKKEAKKILKDIIRNKDF